MPISLGGAERIYPIILSLETLALDLTFPHLSEPHLLAMQRANDDLRTALSDNAPHRAVEADTALHQVLIDAADNPELRSLLGQLKTKYKRLELAYFGDANALSASYQEHQALLAALKSEQLAVAQGCLADNWRSSAERLRASGG